MKKIKSVLLSCNICGNSTEYEVIDGRVYSMDIVCEHMDSMELKELEDIVEEFYEED